LDLQVSSSILFIFLIHFSSGPSIHWRWTYSSQIDSTCETTSRIWGKLEVPAVFLTIVTENWKLQRNYICDNKKECRFDSRLFGKEHTIHFFQNRSIFLLQCIISKEFL
jgi:hypothetical protein